MPTQIIPNSPAHSTGTDTLWEKPTLELDANTQQVTEEWIQSLSPEIKDAALLKFCKIVEAKPTLVESLTLNQVLYRTISGGTFTESADNVAARTGHDRKTILKGLNQAVSQNILSENKRPGTSNEYSFKPVEEWFPEPERVVHIKDIRKKKIRQCPLSQNSTQSQSDEGVGVVLTKDDHETDANNNIVVVNKIFHKEQQQVTVQSEDGSGKHWKYVGQGLPRVYVAPELDQETGSKIESIHSATLEPRQFIIKNAVELLYDSMKRIPSVAVEKPAALTPLSAVAVRTTSVSSIPVQKSHLPPTDEALTEAMRELRQLRIEDNATVRNIIKRLWHNFQDAYESIKQRVERREPFVNITGAFVNALKNGDKPEVAVVVEEVPIMSTHGIDEPTTEEMALIDDAIANGRAKDKYYGSLGWLVIENNGHTTPWQQFLTLLLEGHG